MKEDIYAMWEKVWMRLLVEMLQDGFLGSSRVGGNTQWYGYVRRIDENKLMKRLYESEWSGRAKLGKEEEADRYVCGWLHWERCLTERQANKILSDRNAWRGFVDEGGARSFVPGDEHWHYATAHVTSHYICYDMPLLFGWQVGAILYIFFYSILSVVLCIFGAYLVLAMPLLWENCDNNVNNKNNRHHIFSCIQYILTWINNKFLKLFQLNK